MKTAQIIAQTTERNSVDSGKASKPKRKMHANSLKNLAAQWKPGESGNVSGRPKDIAGEISRAAFEKNSKAIYEAVVAKLLAGDAYAFSVHSDRGYGKLKELKEITHVHQDVADSDLQSRIDSILRDIGLARAVDEAGGVEVATGRAEKTNGKAKDTPVLS